VYAGGMSDLVRIFPIVNKVLKERGEIVLN